MLEPIQPRLIRLPTVLELTQLNRSTLYELMAADDFPRQVKLGPRACAWLLDEVNAWIDERVKARKTTPTEENP